MKEIYDRYAIKIENLDSAKVLFEQLTNIKLHLRYSSYKGEYYSNFSPDIEEEYEIKNNYFEPEGWLYEEYKGYNIILHVFSSPQANEIKNKLLTKIKEPICVISRTIIDDEKLLSCRYKYINGQDELVETIKLPLPFFS